MTADPRDALAALVQLGEENLAELKRMNSTERSGAVSSIVFEDAAKGDPRCTTKFYVGSPLTRADVDAVLDIHAYAHRRAAERALDGWAETVDALAAKT